MVLALCRPPPLLSLLSMRGLFLLPLSTKEPATLTYFHVVLGELYSPNKHTGAERDGETLWQKEDQDKGEKNKNTAREGLFFFKQGKKIPEREENPGGFVVLCALCGKYQGLYIYKYSFYQQNKYFCSSPKFLRLNHKVATSLLFLRVIFEVALYKSSTYRFFKTYF